ncbi:Predicted dehydrogenase [Dyella jiangningensis]|uniref:oxidoreductase n=1 Tax=Dyella sp. AtDHG13 TaxID=1938897 RepID=UPI00088BDBDB|nr:oxidoreductase [Dyella sp. AtDHG13]PXV59072.1 putative dehydrogenase [Dyella sp. AtDHG13]SDL27354.1 Predicted dehydrogenase [Dyella jiangningensis]
MSTSTTPLRVALIGYGFAGKTFHAPLIRGVPGLALSTVVSRDAGKVYADLPDVEVVATPEVALADPTLDMVVIASPNDTHAPLARAALQAGKHVVVDKPFALDVTQARELAAVAEREGRVLSVFQNRRWDTDFLGVRQLIADGRLGDVTHFESHIDRFRPQVRERWREQPGAGSGLWYDLGPHLVDQALCLFGLPDRVWASLAVQRDGGSVTDWAHVVLEYGQRRVLLHASMLVAGGSPRFIVHGTRGSAVKMKIDPQEAQLLAGLRPGDAGWGEDSDALLLYDGNGNVEQVAAPRGDQSRYYAAFRDAVRGQGANPVTPKQAITVMAVIEAAMASAANGQAVELALSEEERAAWAAA